MPRVSFEQLLEAGAHFGHQRRKWNPNMAPFIFMERDGIHILDLHKTVVKLDEAASAMKQIAKSGRKVLFVATKKQAKDIIAEQVGKINMPYVTERWSGGMLTNFPTIRKAVKKMATIDKMESDGTFAHLSKRERLQIQRQRAKLDKTLGSIADLTRLPAALFVVDIQKEKIAIAEARRLNIPVFAMVDTNSDPNLVDYVIPCNDDAAKAISLVVGAVTAAIEEGLSERKVEKDKNGDKDQKSSKKETKTTAKKTIAKKQVVEVEEEDEDEDEIDEIDEIEIDDEDVDDIDDVDVDEDEIDE